MGQLTYKDGDVSCNYEIEMAKSGMDLVGEGDRHTMTLVNSDQEKMVYRETNVDYISVLEVYKVSDELYYGEWRYDEGKGTYIGYVKISL